MCENYNLQLMKLQTIAILCLLLAFSAIKAQDLPTLMVNKMKKTDYFTADQLENAKFIMQGCMSYTQDQRKLAYILTTAIGESSLRPVRENRCEPGTACYQVQQEYWYTGYYGRGFVQITHRYNYERFGQILGIDLVGNPDLALRKDIAGKIICHGMHHGIFTGLKLDDFFSGSKADWFNARKIIYGLDRAQELADKAQRIYNSQP